FTRPQIRFALELLARLGSEPRVLAWLVEQSRRARRPRIRFRRHAGAQMAAARLEQRLPLSRSAERSCRVHRFRLSAALCYPIARPRRCPAKLRWTVLRRPFPALTAREINLLRCGDDERRAAWLPLITEAEFQRRIRRVLFRQGRLRILFKPTDRPDVTP